MTVIGYLAWNEGVRGLDPSRASVYLYPITPLSLLAAVVVLDEPWSPALGISCVLVLGGVALAQRGDASTHGHPAGPRRAPRAGRGSDESSGRGPGRGP